MSERQLRHYLYVSDRKVAAILDHIERSFLTTLALKFKISVGVLTADVDVRNPKQSRIPRLLAAEEFLFSRGAVGTIQSPSEYVHDSLDMRAIVAPRDHPEVVFFGGALSRQWITDPASFTDANELAIGMAGDALHVPGVEVDRPSLDSVGLQSGDDIMLAAIRDARSRSGLMTLLTSLTGPTQRMEFLARTMWKESANTGSVRTLLLSPLFVSLM